MFELRKVRVIGVRVIGVRVIGVRLHRRIGKRKWKG